MDELTNYAEVVGTYNLHETEIKSNSVTTILITNLEITKSANKLIWAIGNLKYTITVSNPNGGSVHEIIITDVLNPDLIRLVQDSITINGVPAGYGNFTYDEATGLLTYTITINNQSLNPYVAPIVTDTVDPALATLVLGSVRINGVVTTDYTFDVPTGLLTVNLGDVVATSTTIITFDVERV